MTNSEVRKDATGWWAVASAALDVRGVNLFDGGPEIILVPAIPSEPLSLLGSGAVLWRRLVDDGPLNPAQLEAGDEEILSAMAGMGIAALGPPPPFRVQELNPPTLSSPLHEMVYAVVARVAEDQGIRCVFVKGPVLHFQGLRDREHSGDVDVWCDPQRWEDLVAALGPWGWDRVADPWEGTTVNHSATLVPKSWGCEVDVHRRMPGLTLEDDAAFEQLWAHPDEARFAGQVVRTPSRPMHAVISAVHSVRPELGRPHPSPLASAAARDLLRLTPGSVDCAKAIGAVPALRVELSSVADEDALRGYNGGTPRDWSWRGKPDRVRAYLAAMTDMSVHQRIHLLWRLFWPTPAVARESARRAGHQVHTLTGARVRRIGRALGAWLRITVSCSR
ncbi:nucleotidyltransferase family protein [Microbacterium testaceum]|uniref:nucleotidyltransferase family protein n=1 Tax=Microbacterium testaceum TaxID=2033 RepID=UPI002AC64EEF|nr:nucleotidyltransferase family protein [Microbacterium testaceum]MDZ5146132.1 nucleotidyltransferase family protein [Microbacterium testaceum]